MKNCRDCFNVASSKDLKYCDSLYHAIDCMDTSSFGEKIEKVYESGTVGITCYDVKFSSIVTESSDITYSFAARLSKNCFGCSAVRRAQYQIFNKQYSQEEYLQLMKKIILHMQKTGEWGQFFPMNISPYGYNETIAQEFFPLTQKRAEKAGVKWKEENLANRYVGVKYEIADDIRDVDDSLTSQILTCESCAANYKVIKQELDFHKKHNLPVSPFCPDCRHKARIAKRNPNTLFKRECAKCGDPIETTYAPERPAAATAGPRSGGEKVYCEKCYLKEVY